MLYWSWSWNASFPLSHNKRSLLKRPESVPHQFLCHVLRNLMFVVSVCDDSDERLLLFGEFNLVLRGNQPTPVAHSYTANICTSEAKAAAVPLTLSWWRRRVCCRRCQRLPRLRSTVLARPWCSFVAFLIYTGSPSAGLQAGTKTPLCLFHTCAGIIFSPPHP